MKRSISIGNWEAVMILINVICAKIYLGFPRETVIVAGTAGWIMTLYVSILAFLGLMIILRLYRRFEGKDLLDLGEHLGGGAGRITVGIILIGFILYILPMMLRIFAEDMKVISFPQTPIGFITLFLIAGMVASAYSGIEGIARIAAIGVAFVAISYLVILIGVIPFYDLSNILPLFGSGGESILVNGSLKVSTFSELIYLFLLIPFLRSRENLEKVGKWAVVLSGIFLVVGSLTFVLTFPYPQGLERVLPIYQMTRLINFGRFLQRVEALFIISWAIASLMYVSTSFFLLIHVFRKTFKLEYHRPLILPFTVIVFVLSFLPPNLAATVKQEADIFRNWSWVITFGMTILLLLVARWVKNRPAGKKKGKTPANGEVE